MNIETLLTECANKFSSNKATNTAYKKIFYLIYKMNIEDNLNNEFGFTEIDCRIFKSLSKRKYKDMLNDMFKHGLIYTNLPLSKSNTGRDNNGKKITRGYKVDRSLIGKELCDDEVKPLEFTTISKSIDSISKSIKHISNPISISFTSFPTLHIQYMGTFFENSNGDYDIMKTYSLITLDREKIPYKEGTEEWNSLAKIWNKHTKAYKNMNRIYSWFHQVHGEEREFFTIAGSHLREAFDVPACNFCILAKLLENSNCDKEELKKFQHIIKYEYIYEKIANYLNLDISDKAIKKAIKASCQHWLNIRKSKLHTGSWNDEYFNGIDKFFKSELPSIYSELINWREEKHNGKVSKMLWYDFQAVEYEIISKKICNYLYKRYKATPVTVHDAIYLTDTDRAKIDENLEEIFWNELNLKYVN